MSVHAAGGVLVLANRLPYPVDDGWKVRTYHLLRGFLRRGSVTYLAYGGLPARLVEEFCDGLGGGLEVRTVAPVRTRSLPRVAAGLLTPTPLHVWNVRSRRFARAVREVAAARSFDVAVAELTYMYPYLDLLPHGVRKVIDTHNVDSAVLRRYAATMRGRVRRFYAAATARKLEAFERRVYADADIVWVCSADDAGLARRIAPAARVEVVPNGVDTAAFAPMAEIGPVPGRLLFFGRMDYEPNRDALHHFADSILPELNRRGERVELHVAGAGIGADLERLARRTPGLQLRGRVDDLRPLLAEAAAVVVPLRMGGGTRLKILEALSAGRAVVSTTIGAEGLSLRSGHDALLADEPADFAAAVQRILHEPGLADKLGANGRTTAVRCYDWAAVHDKAGESLGW